MDEVLAVQSSLTKNFVKADSMRLFLDFDGVLHPFFYRHSNKAFCYVPRLEAVLKDFPAVQIIITGMHTAKMPLARLTRNFSPDIAKRIIGSTPLLPLHSTEDIRESRYREIQTYLRNSYGPWLALDDEADLFPPGCPQLILCEDGFRQREEAALRTALVGAEHALCGLPR